MNFIFSRVFNFMFMDRVRKKSIHEVNSWSRFSTAASSSTVVRNDTAWHSDGPSPKRSRFISKKVSTKNCLNECKFSIEKCLQVGEMETSEQTCVLIETLYKDSLCTERSEHIVLVDKFAEKHPNKKRTPTISMEFSRLKQDFVQWLFNSHSLTVELEDLVRMKAIVVCQSFKLQIDSSH